MKPSDKIAAIQPYYFSKKLAEVRSLVNQGKDIINLGIGSPDKDTPIQIINELQNSSILKGAGQYQSYNGIQELRHAFSQWYKRIYNVNLNPESEVLPLMGSKEAVMHIHIAFCNPGDSVLIPNPGYPTYTASANMLGLNVVYYDLKEDRNWLPSIEELETLVTNSVKVMWVNYPNMPTGSKASQSDLEELILFAQKHGILLVNDNPYSLIQNNQPLSIHACETEYDDVLELNSLSKSHNMSGWRVGVVSGSQENIQTILKVKSNFDSGMYKPIQQAAIVALSLGDEWFTNLNEEYAKRTQIVWAILDQLNCSYDKQNQGLFVWAKVNEKLKTGEAMSDFLLYNYGIFATPGNVFGSNGENYIRFSVCATQEELTKALNRLKELEV